MLLLHLGSETKTKKLKSSQWEVLPLEFQRTADSFGPAYAASQLNADALPVVSEPFVTSQRADSRERVFSPSFLCCSPLTQIVMRKHQFRRFADSQHHSRICDVEKPPPVSPACKIQEDASCVVQPRQHGNIWSEWPDGGRAKSYFTSSPLPHTPPSPLL